MEITQTMLETDEIIAMLNRREDKADSFERRIEIKWLRVVEWQRGETVI